MPHDDTAVHGSQPGGQDCTFCDGHGWLYEQPANVKATCPMCQGSGRFTPGGSTHYIPSANARARRLYRHCKRALGTDDPASYDCPHPSQDDVEDAIRAAEVAAYAAGLLAGAERLTRVDRAVRQLVYHGRCVECGANVPRVAHQPGCRVEEALAVVNASDKPRAAPSEAVLGEAGRVGEDPDYEGDDGE